MMINRIKNNLHFIFNRFTFVVSIVFALLSGIQMFIDWDNIGIDDIKKKNCCTIGNSYDMRNYFNCLGNGFCK